MCIAFVEMAPARKEQASLKAPTRAEQLKFFIESQMLDDSQPRLEKLQLLRRFTERLTRLEQTGGLERD